MSNGLENDNHPEELVVGARSVEANNGRPPIAVRNIPDGISACPADPRKSYPLQVVFVFGGSVLPSSKTPRE
ncbi:hypothetical protein FRACYDRAFT_267403 [Fragilariopsis cylindrus CCMP1102]|uniref:Uncharacterized protein n=1 Tax=Fragilariopsis cylindrus CCMP1102 TaxID=635003 RepID=A0A1E7FXG8_9STRA|nr:hypothetical protein FRACYDRAFT_267403 [Fragilariopsis cylindrus CCMP1102]|eukprot:OEU22840.1 hypothetical protein FRACYDRAFT_267403 [Fragilariopsis cylindrus CCMP1102]